MNSEKIRHEHLGRKAIVYVRQSTMGQVRHHRQSGRRQYELADTARAMGWRTVEVIDEDLGRSGTTAAGRSGFARLVTAVCLREVGAVFSLEASRLARNNRDWYQLLDYCAMVETLIVDFDGVYDPRLLNDRLLLGLKGTMSEFELGLFRQRAHEALHQMARRGELILGLPVGYQRSRDGRCEKDPDLRVQHAIELVFSKFAEYGSVRQVLLWFRQEKMPLPAITYSAQGRTVGWRLPVYNSIHSTLTNPVYAGAYAFGRTTTRTRIVGEHTVKSRGVRREREDWEVLLPEHHAGYISWSVYERNQRQILENAHMQGRMTRGAARSGNSLVAGLLRCARCGRKLHVTYSGTNGTVPRYACRGAAINHGEGKCISFGGIALDTAVEREVLKVVEPAALDATLAAVAEVAGQQDAHRTALELALRQARYEADRARRQYDAVEPENRLVAEELERRWNRALEEVAGRQAELDQVSGSRQPLSDQERTALLALAEDFRNVWRHPTTDMTVKKRIARTVIEEIMADVNEAAATIECVIHWAGGCHTRLRVKKNRTGEHRFGTDYHVLDIVRDLAQLLPDREIVSILNRLRIKTGKDNTWTEARLRSLRHHHEIPAYCASDASERSWVTITDAAAMLGISATSVRRLIAEKILPATQVVPYAPWLVGKAGLHSAAVKKAVRAINSGRQRPLPENPNQKMLDL